MLPSSRKEALEQGSEFYFTGKPCKHAPVSQRVSLETRQASAHLYAIKDKQN